MNKKLKGLIVLADELDQSGFHKLANSVDSIMKYAAEFDDEKTNPGKIDIKPRQERMDYGRVDYDEPALKELVPEGEMKDVEDAHAMVKKLNMFLSKHSWPHQWDDNIKKEIKWLLAKVLELT